MSFTLSVLSFFIFTAISPRPLNDASDGQKIEIDLDDYNRYETIVAYMKETAAQHPMRTTLYNIGKSFEGRDTFALKITADGKQLKPTFLVSGGVHSREWISIATPVLLIDRLVNYHNKDDLVIGMLERFDFVIMPVLNPDGYVYSWTNFNKEHLARAADLPEFSSFAKSGQTMSFGQTECGGKPGRYHRMQQISHHEVWALMETEIMHSSGKFLASPDRSLEDFPGPEPFSEVEIKQFVEFVHRDLKNVKIFVDLHSFMQSIILPWTYTKHKSLKHVFLQSACIHAAEAIRRYNGHNYTCGRSMALMYEVHGSSLDYFYSQGVPLVYTVELPPQRKYGVQYLTPGFLLNRDQIRPTAEEMLVAFDQLITYYISNQQLLEE